jgi:hypothetical protein
VANPSGYYVEDWSSSYHEQAITTLRGEEVVEIMRMRGRRSKLRSHMTYIRKKARK